jgi:FlaA1/EpsC-like NDP-sugar epimerase
MALHFAARCAEHPARGDGADARAAGAGLHFRRAQRSRHGSRRTLGAFFLGKITIVLYWFLEVFFLSALRFAYRYFRYTRARYHARTDEDAAPTLLIGRAADAEICCAASKAARSSGCGRSACCRRRRPIAARLIRNIPVLGGIDDIEDVIEDFARRNKPIARVVMTPSAFEPEARPESVLMRARGSA